LAAAKAKDLLTLLSSPVQDLCSAAPPTSGVFSLSARRYNLVRSPLARG
jgi:hypothetical protein